MSATKWLLSLPTPDRFPPLGLSPARKREETFRTLLDWLHTRASRKPILFVIEDLHWADASTLEFLGLFLTEGLHDSILTVLTYRPEFKAPWPEVAQQTTLAQLPCISVKTQWQRQRNGSSRWNRSPHNRKD